MNIPQPRFLLRKPNATSPTMIHCHVKFNNQRVPFATGEKIVPVQWDSIKQRAINLKKFPRNSELNIWLDKIDSEIKSIFRSFILDSISPTADLVRNKINERVFNKTFGRIPKPLTNQKINVYLKVIGRMSDIVNKMEINRTKARKRTRKLVPKYELIRTHTCRKSFATNAFHQGLSTLSIMKITGHNVDSDQSEPVYDLVLFVKYLFKNSLQIGRI
jgi:hypothetical protein